MDAIERLEYVRSDKAIDPTALQLARPERSGFADLISSAVETLNGGIANAEQKLSAFALGDAIPAHEVMVAMEQARFGLQFAVEVRNRVVEAYSELTRLQI